MHQQHINRIYSHDDLMKEGKDFCYCRHFSSTNSCFKWIETKQVEPSWHWFHTYYNTEIKEKKQKKKKKKNVMAGKIEKNVCKRGILIYVNCVRAL